MPRWTTKQVLDAAPDAASITAARKLAKPGPWSDTGSTEILLWGKCQGSGKTPYQVSIDLARPAYRCSCPSRKFPCKHALALLLLWSSSEGSIEDAAEAADFAAEWQAQAAATKAARESRAEKPVDAEAQAKRLAHRLDLMDAGINDFTLWLRDLVRTGLAAARSQPYQWWDATAARLVDAQLPGLAEQVRTMASEVMARPDWSDHLLTAVGRWWLATRAWQRRTELDADTMADLRVVLGWTIASEEARQQAELQDSWLVLGSHRTEDGRVQEQRTWLYGEGTGAIVLTLEFAVGYATLNLPRAVGSTFSSTVRPYPGHGPHRVIAEPAPPGPTRAALPPAGDLRGAQESLAAALTRNPWLSRLPVLVRVQLGQLGVTDDNGTTLGYTDGFDPILAMALTGSSPVPCFGELEAGRFRPLSVAVADQVVAL